MLELYSPNIESINTKERITVDLIKQGKDFLEQFDVNMNLVLDVYSLIYRYLRKTDTIPQNLYKFFIAAYYIVSRHPFAFPVHQSKAEFSDQFHIPINSLEYSVDKICSTLDYIRILDDMNYPYFIDPRCDLSLKFIKTMVKSKVEKKMMQFLLYEKPINSQILTEELVSEILFEHNAFPEELMRQLYEIVSELV
ncbi:MAG: hypothetical protein P8Y23_00955, partial [Candidatus Lokiarchaeota archaeon]